MEEPLEFAYKLLLYAHIVGGTLALLTGLISLSTKKGGKVHRTSGKVFFVAMILVAVSAFVISIAKNISFLLAVSVFSFYMNYTGYRALKNIEVKFKWFDWLVAIFSVATALYMISTFTIVLMVFGSILIFLIVTNTRVQFQSDEKLKEARRSRVLTHITNMVGTYIATTTAFLVVNINFVKPGWLLWLLPTLIGTPVIIYFSRIWTKKLKL
jgi:uncharacterized membrane protein